MIHSLNEWTFFDPTKDELHEGYPKRTLAIKCSKAYGSYTVKCYDFPTGKDFRVEVNNMDISGRLETLEDAIAFVKDFKGKSISSVFDTMSFGGSNDMEITLGIGENGEPTRNGKFVDFKAELDKLRGF